MSTDITNEEEKEVELTESDLEVIDEVNRENEPEETSDESSADEPSGDSKEVDEPQGTGESEPDETPGYDDNLVQWANHYGINPGDYSTEDALRRHVDSTARYYQQQQQQQQQQLQQQQHVPEQTAQTEPAAPTEFKVALDEDYDPGLIDGINGLANQMSTHYNDQLEMLAQVVLDQQGFINGQQQQAQSVQYQNELNEFNTAVNGLESGDIFGESGYEQLTPGSNEARNREALYDQVLVLANGYQAQGKQIPGMENLVGQAYRTAFSTEVDNQNRKSLNARLRKQSKRRLGSGSSSKKTSVPTDDPVDNPVLKDAFDGYLKDNGDL
jgi:hypothetical protein